VSGKLSTFLATSTCLLLLGACVPALAEPGGARLEVGHQAAVIVTDANAGDVVLYLSGTGLELDDRDCERQEDGWACEFGGGRTRSALSLEISGRVEAAAALYRLPRSDTPFPLMARAEFKGEEVMGEEVTRVEDVGVREPVLPLPPTVRAMAPDPGDAAWVGRSDFEPSGLGERASRWYQELLERTGSAEMMSAARSGNLYDVARYMNLHVTALLLTFSETRDLKLLDVIDEAMQSARDELRDAWLDGTRDGYRGWLYTQEANADTRYFGKDNLEIDEMMAHGMVAAVTYAYYLNRFSESPGGVDYNERFQFWSDFLINDFEAKWRERNDVKRGFPFVDKFLTHPKVGMMRYLYYMGLLGYERHAREARKMADDIAEHFKRVETPGGDAYVFDHGFDEPYGMVRTIYARYTLPVILELSLTGLKPFDEEFVRPFANTVAYLLLDREPFESEGLLAPDVGGGKKHAGISRSDAARSKVRYDSNRLPEFVPFIRYDESGRILDAVRETNDDINAYRTILAAGMVFGLSE
jgi:hypothetical protein